ncbi:MAG: hypothetical protein PVJ75_08725 [Chloroflexota bacterium]|jgi:hypothetical protein
MPDALTNEYIQSVIKNDNLVVRNLQVTQGYYRLSEGLRRCLSSANVNWCTFATHASKTAGQALRHELMPRYLRSAMIRMAGFDNTFLFLDGLDARDESQLGAWEGRLGDALRRLSHLVSQGNIVVFKELAWPFAAFIHEFRKDWRPDEGKIQDFLTRNLQPGPLEEGGQDYLIEAFRVFYYARYERDAKKKAELILQGNLLIGLHEQTRLQPQIEQAMTLPLRLFSKSAPGGGGKRGQSALMRRAVSKAVTQMMMSITLPSRELKLGENVIAPTGVFSYPDDLLVIESARCLELVRAFEFGQDTLTGSAAENWASLRERMSFVVDFFRSHQQYQRMWDAPFQPEQARAIELGHFPAGPL